MQKPPARYAEGAGDQEDVEIYENRNVQSCPINEGLKVTLSVIMK